MTSNSREVSRLVAPSPDGHRQFAARSPVTSRVLIILGGYLAACLAAALALSSAYAVSLAGGVGGPIEFIGLVIAFEFFLTGFVLIFALLPSLLAIICAEYVGARSIVCYCGVGALVGVAAYGLFALLEILAAGTEEGILPPTEQLGGFGMALIALFGGPGLVGGVIYWLIAGRTAGAQFAV